MSFSLNRIFRKEKGPAGGQKDFSFLGTDMHSHLIPGIDDGSPDTETSLLLIKKLQRLGYRKLITTPHVLQDYYPNDTHTIKQGYQILQQALDTSDIPVKIQVAAEYFLDNHVMGLIDNDEPLLTLSENKVLVEFSLIAPPMHRDDFLFKLRVKEYEPVIAHPERYPYFHHDFDEYQRLSDKGYAMQVNLLSFTGHYGKSVQKAANQLLDKKLVQYLGTDLHHLHHAEALRKLCTDTKLMNKLIHYPWQNDQL